MVAAEASARRSKTFGDPHRLGTLCVLMVGLCRDIGCLPPRRRSLFACVRDKNHT
jgi:hypothetical protein